MKTLFKTTFIILMSLIALVQFSACTEKTGCTDPLALNYDPDAKKSSGDCRYADPTPAPETTGTLKLHLHQHFGAPELDTLAVYTMPNGQRVKLNQVRYYLSNFKLKNAQNEEVSIEDSYLLVNPANMDYTAGKIPAGTYKSITFYLGVDSATNSGGMMPTDRPAGHPLAIQNPSMFWTWASGYIFMRLEGLADTIGTVAPDHALVYHIGTNALRRSVTITFANDLVVTAGQNSTLHVKTDFKPLFEALDFKTESLTMTMGNMPLALKIANLAGNIFSETH